LRGKRLACRDRSDFPREELQLLAGQRRRYLGVCGVKSNLSHYRSRYAQCTRCALQIACCRHPCRLEAICCRNPSGHKARPRMGYAPQSLLRNKYSIHINDIFSLSIRVNYSGLVFPTIYLPIILFLNFFSNKIAGCYKYTYNANTN